MYSTILAVRVDWGDAPTWAGVMLAAAAGVTGLLLYGIESRRDRETALVQRKRDDEDRQQQAAQVCAWFGPREHSQILTDQPEWGIWVANGSQLPIYDLTVELHDVTINDRVLEHRHAYGIRVIPPGRYFYTEPLQGLRTDKHQFSFEVSLAYRDAGGRQWYRGVDGLLREDPDRSFGAWPSLAGETTS